MSRPMKCGTDLRLVGDPIDVVTGANVDSAGDLYLAGPFSFDFTRYYNSANHRKRGSLGWGHTHEFEHMLVFDLDGLEYCLPSGGRIFFPAVEIGEKIEVDGMALTRPSKKRWVITTADATLFFDVPLKDRLLLGRMGRGQHAIRFEYDDQYRINHATDSAGRKLRFEYTDNQLLESVTWINGRGTDDWRLLEYRYDQAGNLERGIDAYGNEFRFEFDHANRMTRKTDRRGYSFFYQYDADGRCVESHGQDGLHKVELEYLPEMKCTKVVRADGGLWQYFYSDTGTIEKIINPEGGKTEYTIAEDGLTLEEIEPDGSVWKWVYEGDGQLLGKQNDLGQFRPIDGEPEDVEDTPFPTNPAQWMFGRSAHLTGRNDRWDHQDFVLGQRPDRIASLKDADRSGQLIQTKDGRTYDHFGNLVKQEFSDGTHRRWSYDANGCMTQYVDRDGAKYSFEYDSWNIQTTALDPLGNAFHTEVNAERFITKATDAGGHAHEFSYDANDRLASVSRFGQVKESYEYDFTGNLKRKRNGDGGLLFEKEFGNHQLATRIKTGDGADYSLTYDDFGKIATITQKGQRLEFAHDGYSRRSVDLRDGDGVENEFDDFELTSTTVLGKFVTNYDHSSGGKIVTDPTGNKHQFSSLRNGVEIKLGNGTEKRLSFTPEGRLKESLTIQGEQNHQISLQYSGEGYVTEIADSVAGTTQYINDAAHRLSKTIGPDGTENEFRYDHTNNLIGKIGLEDVQIGLGNQLLSANGERFEYNDRHAIAARTSHSGTTRYRYNTQDQLIAADIGGEPWSAQYDATGRRISKTNRLGTTTFYWDNNRLTAEVLPDQSVRVYVYADWLAATPFMFVDYEGLDADPESGVCHYIHTNHLGAPVAIEDAQGATVWQASYDAYGKTEWVRGSLKFNLRLPGHYYDQETELHYNRHRYYDPGLGRYIQPDPIGLGGGSNLYAYCHNPSSEVDLEGLKSSPPCGGKRTQKSDKERTDAKNRKHKDGDGITPEHIERIKRHAKEHGQIVIFREPNPKSRPYSGNKDYVPKPAGLPTGNVPGSKPPKRICKTGDDGLVKWNDDKNPPTKPGYSVDDDGNLLYKNKKIYSDYDLENVHDNNTGEAIGFNTDNSKGKRNVKNLNKSIHRGSNPSNEQKMIQHGPNGQYVDDNGQPNLPPYDKKTGKWKDEQYTAVTPEGDVLRFENPQQLKDFYDAEGLDWPYPDPPSGG